MLKKISFDAIKSLKDQQPKLASFLRGQRFTVFVYANILLYLFAGVLVLLRLFGIV